MTTQVTIHPAGHHVRVTTTENYPGTLPKATAHELEPGQAQRVFYVHSNMSLQVEEYVPGAPAAPFVPASATTSGLPIPGYQDQTKSAIDQVTANKHDEERILRVIDGLVRNTDVDGRWLAIARTNIEQGFMALNRAIFKPTRVQLPEDLAAPE